MNERIFTELYKKAWGHFPCPTGEPELEKFAELLIRECISKCEFVADMSTITNKGEMARKTKATADSCAKMIKEHFGVGE